MAWAPDGKYITGTSTRALMAMMVASRFFWVTPVDPPTMIASVPSSHASPVILAAMSGACLFGSRRVIWSVSLLIFSSRVA